MIAKANFRLGGVVYSFEFDDVEELAAMNKAISLSNPRTKCICGNEDSSKFYMTTNKDREGHIFVNVKCAACGARSKLGSLKSGGYFWHEFEVYTGQPTSEVV